MDAKVSFQNQLEHRLRAEITAECLDIVMRAVADTLATFDMHENAEGNPEQDDLLGTYLAAISVQGLSRKTVYHYGYVLKRLIKACGVPVRRITVYHIRNFIAAEKARGIQDSTLRSHRDAYSAFFGWLFRENLIEKNPMVNIGPIKCQQKKKKIFSDVELEKLTAKCAETSFPERNRAIIEFLKSTGCRISEMTSLNRNQVDLQKLEVVVLGKGNKERIVYLSEVTAMVMKAYLDSREDDEEMLFIGNKGERLQPGGVRIMLKQLGKKAGVENVHPHRFRRTLATNLCRRGMPLQEIATVLGHAKLDTTMKYVVLNNDDIKQAYRRCA